MNAPARTGRILPDLTEALPPIAVRQRGRRSRIDEDTLRAMVAAEADDDEIATHFGCSKQTVYNHRTAIGLLRRRKKGSVAKAAFHSRHEPKSLDDKIARMPPINHPALTEARTIYPATVVPVAGLLNLLVSGENSWKIGERITKGRWAGFPIFTLTLQERATCPTSCVHWRSCYGNSMNWAKRISHGPAFEDRLVYEVGLLSYRHPGGFAVRLHVLGDFYSVGYVKLWRSLVERFPNLHVFGFTARVDNHDPIAQELSGLIADHWPRFGVRLSNAAMFRSTVTIEHPVQKPADAIVCPQQTGKTASCGTCALCWSTDRRIAFLRH